MANGILKQQFDFHNAGFHNSIYRGLNLGTSVTTKQQNEISAGTFNNLFIGDYWVINNLNWRIASFDYFLHTGDTECTTHHILLIPGSLGTGQHQTTNTSTGGYKNSLIWKNWFASATGTGNAFFNNAFGAEHRLSHRELISNAVSSSTGKSSGWEWIDVPCGNLLNECMISGAKILGNQFDIGINSSQLPLFALAPRYRNIGAYYWLSTVAATDSFSYLHSQNYVSKNTASSTRDIRPYFVYA